MSASNAPSARRPIEVKRGNVTVKIYRTINHVGGVDYHQFTLAY